MRVFCILLCFAGGLSASKSQVMIDWEGLEAGQRARNERASHEFLAYMSVETMFPEERVRTLAKAAGAGRLKIVERLAAEGVNVNARGNKGATPLYWTLLRLNLEGFQKLLELGADPNLVFACTSVMHRSATKHRDSSFLRAALAHGGDPNLRAGVFGETPLFKTVGLSSEDRRDSMRLLLESGADINIQTTDNDQLFGVSLGGSTPIMKAAMIGSFNTVYELLELGADYEMKDDMGNDLAVWVSRKLTRYIPGSPQARDLHKVIDWLTARGVEIPPRE